MTRSTPTTARGRTIRAGIAALALAAAVTAATPRAEAVIPAGSATYEGTVTGTVSEWNGVLGAYQITGQPSLPVLVLVEPKVGDPNPAVRVVGIFTSGTTPASDTRPGAIHFATNTQAFRIVPSRQILASTQIDVATVQASPAAGTLRAAVDMNASRTITGNLFRTQSSFLSTPAQILSGSLELTFAADGRSLTGAFDLGGNGLIEPGNPLLPVRRYQATLSAGATSIAGDVGGGSEAPQDEEPPAGETPSAPSGPSAGGPATTRRCAGRVATIVGTPRADRLVGTPRRDVIWAGPGDDQVLARGGNDIVCLGPGRDIAVGGRGDDLLRGEGGADLLKGAGGRDTLLGGAGPDRLLGQAGRDRLFGQVGADALLGGPGLDRGAGGPGRDRIGSVEVRRA